jgi:hypothetical protein
MSTVGSTGCLRANRQACPRARWPMPICIPTISR